MCTFISELTFVGEDVSLSLVRIRRLVGPYSKARSARDGPSGAMDVCVCEGQNVREERAQVESKAGLVGGSALVPFMDTQQTHRRSRTWCAVRVFRGGEEVKTLGKGGGCSCVALSVRVMFDVRHSTFIGGVCLRGHG